MFCNLKTAKLNIFFLIIFVILFTLLIVYCAYWFTGIKLPHLILLDNALVKVLVVEEKFSIIEYKAFIVCVILAATSL